MRTIERAPSRLPMTSDGSSRSAEVARGVAALVGTVAVVVGLPIALYAAFGTPWPDEAPSMQWLRQPVTADTVLGVLAAIVWLAWAHFVVCLVVEIAAERSRRGLAPQVPGGGVGTQSLARRAVAAIALIAGTTAATMGSAGAAVAPGPHHAGGGSSSISATQHAGPGASVGAKGSASAHLPGTDHLLTATRADQQDDDTATYCEVHPPNGRRIDTLWGVAERYLGDGMRYKEIWQMNKGAVQPDGRVLKNPDLIYPGWVLKMPADAQGPGLKVVRHAPADRAPVGAEARGGTAHVAQGDQGAGAVAQAAEGTGGGSDVGGWSPLFGVVGGLAVAGAALGLRRRRGSLSLGQLWAVRRTPAGPEDPGPGPGGPGRSVREVADTTTASWLDRGLRGWAAGGLQAQPVGFSLGTGGLAVLFDRDPEGPVPDGWSDTGRRAWLLGRDAQPHGSGPAAFPGLVSVGRRDDGSVAMVDLEAVEGVVALEGADHVARGLAQSLAVDTATHPWADRRQVTMVGFADDLTAVGQGTLRHSDRLSRVLESLENVARQQRAAAQEAGAGSARHARAAAADMTRWTYHLVVCSGVPAAEELEQLRALAVDPLVSLAVVVVGAVEQAALRLTARGDGRLVAPMAGIDVTPQVLTVSAARRLVAAYDVPDATGTVGLEQLVDVLEAEGRLATEASDAVARLEILGPVRLQTAGPLEEERRDLLTELACLLALHPEGLHANRISAALWPRGVDDEVRDAVLSQLATALGTGSQGAAVLSAQAGVWRLAGGAVSCDWDDFRAALNRAATDGDQRERHLRSALGLVRGRAFADVPAARYAWLESTSVETDVDLAVGLTAMALADAAEARGDVQEARAALDRGLALLPANEDLWRGRLLLARRSGDRASVQQAAEEMYAAIAEHGSPLGASAATDALVDELLPGWRTRVA